MSTSYRSRAHADLKMGIYRHYKGQLYQVIGLAHDANDESRTCVVYIGLQLDGAHLGPRLAVRNYREGDDPFISLVEDPSFPSVVYSDGSTGNAKPRFTYLGPVLTTDMVAEVSDA